MFFDKKEDESKLPDLPPLKPYAGSDQGEGSMPTFPEAPESQEAYAPEQKMIEPPPIRKPIHSHPPMPKSEGKVVEMEEWHPRQPMNEGPEEVEERKPRYVPEPMPQRKVPVPEQNPGDVFVRIDKFHSARKALTEIENKLVDIDELVKRIRETKLREEQELASWEKDIIHIKSRVQGVAESIFEKVE